MSSPHFFVLMATHNRSGLLERAIGSVRDQTYSDWQLFVLDDGSSDDTPKILEREARNERIHTWRFDGNEGVNAARNFLLERILEQPEPGFIVLLDDDDTLVPDALERFAEGAAAHPKSRWFIAKCQFPSGEPVTQIGDDETSLCYVRDHKLGDRLSGDVSHVFHTDLVGSTRYSDDFLNAEEWWFFAGLATRSEMTVLPFHAKTVEYLDEGLTQTQPNRDLSAEVYARKLERFEPFMTRSDRASLEARLARNLYARGERREGRATLWKALRTWPFEYRVYTYALLFLLGRA